MVNLISNFELKKELDAFLAAIDTMRTALVKMDITDFSRHEEIEPFYTNLDKVKMDVLNMKDNLKIRSIIETVISELKINENGKDNLDNNR